MAQQQTQIYVGDLPCKQNSPTPETTVTEDFLRQLFGDIGQIVNGPSGVVLKVKNDRRGRPFAFAFITFETREDAERVINELNYTKLDGMPIRLAFVDKELNRIRRSNQGNLFIKNLDPAIEVSQLHEAFANFGEIISCKIPTDNGVSRGYGYVQFRNPDDANQAMNDLKDASINGRPVKIEPYCRRQHQNPAETFTNCYVKNLPESIRTEEDLKALFAEFGEVDSPKLPLDENQKNKGFGFCSMKTHEQAVKAVEGLNGKVIDGHTLNCNRAMLKKDREAFLKEQTERWRRANYEKYKGRNLYVRNFDETVTDEDLRNLFSQYGQVESVKVMRDQEGVSKKFGFVCFTSQEAAQECIKKSALLKFGDKQCYVALAMTKEERIRQNQLRNQTSRHPPAPIHMEAQHQMQSSYLPRGPLPQAPQMPGQIPQSMGQPMMNPMMNPYPPAFGGMNEFPGAFPPTPYPQFQPPQQLDAKQMIRQEIMELKQQSPDFNTLLQRWRDMSEEQAQQLSNDQKLLNDFLANK